MKTFYDIHTHAFDLSHPNLSVFLQREDLIDSVVDNVWTLSSRWLLPFASLIPKSSIKKFVYNKVSGFRNQLNNTLAFFEIPVEYQFPVIDYFLKNGAPAGPDGADLQSAPDVESPDVESPDGADLQSASYPINSNQHTLFGGKSPLLPKLNMMKQKHKTLSRRDALQCVSTLTKTRNLTLTRFGTLLGFSSSQHTGYKPARAGLLRSLAMTIPAMTGRIEK